MTDEQKQIEEMAKVMLQGEIAREKGDIYCSEHDSITQINLGIQRLAGAKALISAGYRKQSDTAREILRMVKDKGLFRYGGYLLHDSDFDTIGKLYGVEVEE